MIHFNECVFYIRKNLLTRRHATGLYFSFHPSKRKKIKPFPSALVLSKLSARKRTLAAVNGVTT